MARAYGASNLLFWYARVPQIAANARVRATGALSGLSTAMQAAGGAGACDAAAQQQCMPCVRRDAWRCTSSCEA